MWPNKRPGMYCPQHQGENCTPTPQSSPLQDSSFSTKLRSSHSGMNSFTHDVNLGLPLLAESEHLTRCTHVSKRNRRDAERVLSNMSWLGGKNSSYTSPTNGSRVVQYTSHRELPNSPYQVNMVLVIGDERATMAFINSSSSYCLYREAHMASYTTAAFK